MADIEYSTPPIQPRALGVEDAAAYIGVKRGLLYRLIGEGNISARKLGGRTVILREDLDRFLEGLPLMGGEVS